jgi:hypothetical protein
VPSDRLLVSQPDGSLLAAGLDETRQISTDSTGAGVPGLATACRNSVNTARPHPLDPVRLTEYGVSMGTARAAQRLTSR